jgi:nitroreductase
MRTSRFNIDDQFLKRFSPRKFKQKPISENDLLALIEAASTAPSCFNEQPWVFVLASKEMMLSLLTEKNALWAKEAAEIILVCSHPALSRSEKPNRWHAYDSGTAMGYLILEALKRNIYAHPMAGFDAKKAVEMFDLKEIQPHAALALGYSDEAHLMTPRKVLADIMIDRRSG